MAGHLYRPEQKIKGSVCLIKCTKSMTKHSEDYGLIEVSNKLMVTLNQINILVLSLQTCEQKVDIHSVEGDHRSILKADSAKKVAEIVSKMQK